MPKTVPKQSDSQVPVAAAPAGAPIGIGEGLFSPNAGADGKTHFSASIDLATDGHPASLLIDNPGETGTVQGGGTSVCLTHPLKVKFEHLKDYLGTQGATVPESLSNVMERAELDCVAFYYRDSGPMLLSIALKCSDEQKGGLIAALTNSPELGKLFDVEGVSLRVLKCPEACQEELETYWKAVSALPSSPSEEKDPKDVNAPPAPTAEEGGEQGAGAADTPAAVG